MNRIKASIQKKGDKKILSIYFTAGYPNPEDTTEILKKLEGSGVDMVEIGLPFSDPLADGPTIQESSQIALAGGMTTRKLFQQLGGIREQITMPLIIMGYFNPILQFGVEDFCRKCQEAGIDGLIIPDLPLEEYVLHYRQIFQHYGLDLIFLVTPQTPEKRIREIDKVSEGFIYLVSSASVTGATRGFGPVQKEYFKRIAQMGLRNPLITGFGIYDAQTFKEATRHTDGAIVGSAFIKHLTAGGTAGIQAFIDQIRQPKADV